MSSPMVRICAVQFFAWFAWFTFLLFITTWVGETIFHGDPSAPSHSPSLETFREGVRFGALGLTVFAAVTMVSSLVLPILAVPLGIKPVFFVCQLIFAICLFLPLWIDNKIGSVILISICGIPWTAVMIFPFTVVSMSVDESESGLYIGVLNIFVVVPQIIVGLGIGMIVNIFNGKVVSALVSGSISAFISAILVCSLQLKQKLPVEIATNFIH